MERLRSGPARVYTVRELGVGSAPRRQEDAHVAAYNDRDNEADSLTLAAQLDAQQQHIRQLRAELRQQHAKNEALTQLALNHAAQLSATLAAIPGGVWICNQYGVLTAVNEGALAMFGLSPASVALHTIDDVPNLFAPGYADRDICFGMRAALSGRTVRGELVLQPAHLPDKIVTVSVTASPMHDVDGTVIGAVAVVHDITEQKAMERVKDDFLAVAAHELKTPVTAIKGYAQLARMRLSSGNIPLLQRALQTIDEQAARMAHLVSELIDANRIQGGRLEFQLEAVNLVQLVEDCVIEARARTTLHEITLSAPKTMLVVCDAHRIRQVVENLLDNAIKYSPKGGSIDVALSIHNQLAQVIVRDHGIGIAPEKQPHVFDAWFQAHGDTVGDYGGMGLGLNICKEIIERHGGRMWLESAEGQGSLFGFSLPLPPS